MKAGKTWIRLKQKPWHGSTSGICSTRETVSGTSCRSLTRRSGACTREGKLANQTLEDALEVHLFAGAKEKFGASMFVTADGGILQNGIGVHPEKIVTAYPDVFPRK